VLRVFWELNPNEIVARNTPKVKNNSFLFFFVCVEPQIDGSNKHLEVFGCTVFRGKFCFCSTFILFLFSFFTASYFQLCQILLIIEMKKGGNT
jgi:hypothetical protein